MFYFCSEFLLTPSFTMKGQFEENNKDGADDESYVLQSIFGQYIFVLALCVLSLLCNVCRAIFVVQIFLCANVDYIPMLRCHNQ